MEHGKLLQPKSVKICVLYDPKDGRVVHVHGVTTVDGGKEVSQAELEQRAITHAKALGRFVEGAKPLHLPFSAIRQHGGLRVIANGTGLVPSHTEPSVRELREQHRKPSRRG